MRAWLSVPLLALACGASSGAKVVDAGSVLVRLQASLGPAKESGIDPRKDQEAQPENEV